MEVGDPKVINQVEGNEISCGRSTTPGPAREELERPSMELDQLNTERTQKARPVGDAYTPAQIYVYNTYTCMYECMYVCMHACMCVCM